MSKPRMKIGIDVTSLAGGRGPARYTWEILKALAKCSTSQDRYYLYSPFEADISGLPDNFTLKIIPLRKPLPWLNYLLPRQVKIDRPDIMFFPANDCWLWPYVRTVVSILDLAPVTILRDYHATLFDRFQSYLQIKMIPRITDRVITISKYSAGEISTRIPLLRDKISVIYCGLSEAFQNVVNMEYGKADYLLYVGGFDRRKNLNNLLEAYKILLKKGRREKLKLAGSGGANRKLYYDMPKMINEKGLEGKAIIESIKDDKQLAELYSCARLLVMPSLIEGFGLPVLEAMACGCPVACSNAASLPEVGGDAVRYFDPYNVESIADAINDVLTNNCLREQMIEKGLKRARLFSWEKAGQEVYRILKEEAERV